MENPRWLKIEGLHLLGDPEFKRLKVAAPKLWKASYLSVDRPLPGKPPKSSDRLSSFPMRPIFILRHSLLMVGEGGGNKEIIGKKDGSRP
jgi:hypothetical protein